MSEITIAPPIPVQTNLLHQPGDTEPRLDFVEYWRTLRKAKWAILAFALAVSLVAGVIAFVSTPIFSSKTTVMIETNKQKVVTIEDVYGGMGSSREYFQTQVEIMKSREIALKTIKKLKFYDHPDYDPRAPKKGVAAFLQKIGLATQEAPREWNDETLSEAALSAFTAGLSIEPIRLSQLVVIRFESPDAALAAAATDALANTYIENDLNARYEMTHTASDWLQDQLSGLKDKLTKSEQELQAFREKQGIVSLKDSYQNGSGQQVEQIQSRLIEARTRRAELESTYKNVKDASSSGDLASQPAVLINAQVADAKRQLSEADRKLAEVSQRYGKVHPKYMQAESEAKTAADNLKRQVELVVGGISNEYERALGTEKMLESALGAARGSAVSVNRKEFALGVYEREVASNQQMYDLFVKRTKETTVTGDLQTAVARIVDRAVPAKTPIRPNKPLIVGVALALGLLIGVMLALLMEALDNTFKTTEDVEVRLKQALLTVMPVLDKKEAKRSVSGRMVTDSPNSLYAEAIRTARTGVLLSAVDMNTRILVITSSVPGEGKTTFASNLAMAHSVSKKTLLIDADMRRPSIAKSYLLDPHSLGLSELVAGSATTEQALQLVEGTQLTVVTSGAIPPNPLELLHSERFATTLDALAKQFEIIIIDSPPVELVSDAQVIAAKATGVIFVVKAMSTPYPLAKKAIQRMRRANGHVLGVVLNALDFKKAEQDYGEYSGFGKYGYGTYEGTYGGTYGSKTAATAKTAAAKKPVPVKKAA